MNILIMKLCFVFVVIIAILWMKRPLFWAISGGLAAALVLYGIRRTMTLFMVRLLSGNVIFQGRDMVTVQCRIQP